MSLATACYGTGINAGDGDGSSHNPNDVLYIAFTGDDAIPGVDGADWTASNFEEFHASIVDQGNKLIQRLTGDYTPPQGGDDCTWAGHCAGAFCRSADDCSDMLTCFEAKCSPKCSWMGHCEGASCSSSGDCSDQLTCTEGRCAVRN